MKVTAVTALSIAGLAAAGPLEQRQSCPGVYIFGARETTAPAGYGTSQGLVNSVKAAYPGAGSEAITYPACGGQSQCGGVSYDNSASQGTAAVVRAVTAYNQRCPNTQIVLIGYSQVNNTTVTNSKVSTNDKCRVVRSWTTLSVVAQELPSPVLLSKPSRRVSS